ncbi:MAG TPA: hypothetical protein VIV11_35130 [Kofleriaceae bacterium]
MLKTILFVAVSLAACAPKQTTPIYVGGQGSPAAQKPRGVALRGKVPRGKRVDYIVAVQVDRQGKRHRIRVRPAADGSYALQLPRGHRYAMAYEHQGRLIGNVSFPSATGRPTSVINVSQNVVVNQQYIDLGEPSFVGGVFVAAYDPEVYLDSDGDGMTDAQDLDDDGDGMGDLQDPDDSDVNIVADASAFDGDFEDIDASEPAYDDGAGHDDGGHDDGGHDDGGHDDGGQQHDDDGHDD